MGFRTLVIYGSTLALALALTTGGPAVPEYAEINFHTVPPGATIYDVDAGPNVTLGVSGQKHTVRLKGREALNLQFQRGGLTARYVAPVTNITVELNMSDNLEAHVYPKVPVSLEGPWPEKARFYVVDHWLSILGVVAGLGAFFPWMLRRRERLQKLKDLERLRATTDPTEASLIFHLVGPYRLLHLLGKGGMGTVYRAQSEDRLSSKETVALKILHHDASGDEHFRARFLREVRLGKQLQHPNIVGLYDWGEDDGRLYLVMEEVVGQSLRGWLGRQNSWEPLQGVLGQVFAAVDYAHQQGVVHRDLKPDNIMITEAGQVKVTDFGLARQVASQSNLTQSGQILGTPAYLSPEQIQGAEADPRMDQYALGVMLYELVAGRRPFDAADLGQLLYQHLSQPPPPLRDLRGDLPDHVYAGVERMLEKDPDKRFPRLSDAARALGLA